MNSSGILAAVWRHRLLVFAVVIVEFVILALGLAYAPRHYTAGATVSAAPNSDLLQSSGNLSSLQATLGPLATSRAVLEDVSIRIGGVRSIDQLRDDVSASLVTGTVLVRISVVDSDPQVAADVANAVAEALPLNAPNGGLFTFAVAESAEPPESFSSPDIPVVLLAGVVLSVILAVIAALVRDRSSRRVTSPGQVEGATEAGVLAKVLRPKDTATLPALYSGTAAAAVFRQLRISLEFEGRHEDLSTLIVASVCSSDLDGWLGANLSIALAQVDHRVVLVDADLSNRPRHPMLERADPPGLFDVLRGASLDEALTPGAIDELTILPAGVCGGGEQSGDLIEMRFREIVSDLKRRFDIVVILAPPPTVSDDLRVIAAGGPVLLVVPVGKVAPEALRHLTEGLHYVGARLIGSVLVGNSRRGG